MGRVKFLSDLSFWSIVGFFDSLYSSSGGTSSAGGIAIPRAAAISWCSAQDSEKSLRPRQKGARRRSIWSRSQYTGNEGSSILTISCLTIPLLKSSAPT
jgi:hypothetical protein